MDEQAFYNQVAHEIERKQLDNGLWVRAFALALGDDSKARAIYIALRVERLQLEQVAKAEAARQAEAARTERQRAEAAAELLRMQERARLVASADKELRKQQRNYLAKKNKHRQQAAFSGIAAIVGNSFALCLLLVLTVIALVIALLI